MSKTPYILFAFCILLHLFGIAGGCSAVSKMKAASDNSMSYYYEPPPGEIVSSFYSFFPPPKFLVYTWGFILTKILLFILYFAVPPILIWYTFIKREYQNGAIATAIWTFFVSLVGCWIWLFTFMNIW